jgi:hypothetical protein
MMPSLGMYQSIEERARGRNLNLLVCDRRNDFTEASLSLSFIQYPISISIAELEGGLNGLFEFVMFDYECNPCSILSYLPIPIQSTCSA